MHRVLLFLSLVAGALAEAAPAARNRGYVFTAPKRLIAGEPENVCLSLHNLEGPAHVSVDLLALTHAASGNATTAPEEDVLASVKSTLKSGIETCLELRVTSNTKHQAARLRLRVRFDRHPDYRVDQEKKVLIEHDALITFVETDKPIYKPGQDVNVRVLTLKHDLKPWLKPIAKVWIENPSEVRVAQWTNVSTDNGMAQLSFSLSDEPSSGIWRIKVEKARPQLIHAASFEVRKYVLPRFQVTIGAPSYILADAKDATWKVCVRYSYGKPVKGTLLLSLRPQTPIWKRKQTIAEINYEEKLDGASPDGCMNYTVTSQALGLPHWKVAPNNVVLLANFTEAKSGAVETASSRTLVVHQPLKLEFSPHTPKHFKPGLPYHGKLRVLRPDAKTPASGEKIQLCLRIRRKDEWQRSVVECKNFSSPNPQGYLDFVVPPQHKSIVLLSFVATAVDYPTKYYSPDKRWRVFVDQPSAYIDVEPWYSPTSSYLSLSRGYQPLDCNEKYSFNVMYTSGPSSDAGEPVTFHYSINSKGDLLVFGHVKYKPRKDTLLDYSEFPNVLGQRARANTSVPVHRFPLSVKLTPSMAPLSELLLYYVRADGEVVSASHGIELLGGQACFDNQVKSVWHSEQLGPGAVARLHLEAAPDSLCGLSATDRASRFLRPAAAGPHEPAAAGLLEPEAAFARLRPFHLAADSVPVQAAWAHCDKSRTPGVDDEPETAEEEIDHLPKPEAAATAAAQPRAESRRKRHSVTYNVAANYVDAVQAFDDFGVIVMSDLILESRPCPPWRSDFGLRDPLMSQEEVDEPDRMLKAVKAMPLAFQFSGPGSSAGSEASAMNQDIGYADPSSVELQNPNTVRSYFPETWIWELVPTGPEGKTVLERKLPDAITEWIGNAVCVSSKYGLGIGNPVQLTAFQPFFLDCNIPYSVKRGERFRLKVSVFNYMPHGLPVQLRLADHEGLELAFNVSHEASYCIDARDSVVHEFPLVPQQLGELNLTVVAELAENGLPGCGPENLLFARDELIKPLLVQPEGFPVEITRSAFLCPKDFSDDSSLVWELELPSDDQQLVEGSARAYVSLVGDVLGPALDNLEQLVRLPMGCGEQNMILFVPNIHAIAYLDAINRQTGSEMRAKALKNMQKGYQRELNYRHPDGSYSAFGASDEAGSGSMWLTAFVVKSFAQARALIQIDERDLKLSVKWMVRRQLENGCFPVVGQVFHKDMKGGLREEDGSSSALTAYVLIALLESGVPLSAALVNNALYCLEKASLSDHFADNPYTAALTTYALALLEHPRAGESLRALLGRATRREGVLWWEDRGRPGALGLSVEMTAYAVLSLLKLGGEANAMEALRAVRWMSRRRNAQGGFSSTQDTVLGLEALTKYALAMANASATELSVLLTASDLDRLFKINADNRLLSSRLRLPALPTSLELFAEGEGCLLVQSSLKYNKARAAGSEAFELEASSESVSVREDLEAIEDHCSTQRLTVCARYKLPDEESNMAVLEIDMVSGFRPRRDSLNDLLHEHAAGVKRFEDNEATLAIYFDKLTWQKTCVAFEATRDSVVDDPEPANIKLYDYYQQELTVSTNYRFAQVCAKRNDEPAPADREPREPREPSPRLMQKQMDDSQLDNRMSIADQEPRSVRVINLNRDVHERKLDRAIFEQEIAIERENVALPRQREPLRSAAPVTILLSARTATDGSGVGVDEVDAQVFSPSPVLPSVDDDLLEEGFSPAFVNVDHELETPNGVEGPVPVFVEAPLSTTASAPRRRDNSSELDNDFASQESDEASEATGAHPADCPRCENELPPDIKQLFCSSSSAVKVAVRRSRKVRLLLDLGSTNVAKRLRSTTELTLKPECVCPPLDKPGIMALLLSSRDLTHTTKTQLDEGSSMFGLSAVAGTPLEIKDALLSCPRGP
ncbi:pregnancy zone protein-like isoform X2 [Phymastichus coffea]|uniref:pregnancy zone protein-like isoform X2 n=1 Tax=Phymastichus coffea TaxID=108790 RepID=UPI00273B4941|nr:pregnancy zone protein-like isoform X2 [Phymastichus coffea]